MSGVANFFVVLNIEILNIKKVFFMKKWIFFSSVKALRNLSINMAAHKSMN
jgi:hypothetical protein